MKLVYAVVRNGKIEITAPIELTDGTQLRVWLDVVAHDEGTLSPDDIKLLLAAMAQAPVERPS